jgi:lipopolysaccharide/colanic/teichoic acid biosynthesis glycosyltransferase
MNTESLSPAATVATSSSPQRPPSAGNGTHEDRRRRRLGERTLKRAEESTTFGDALPLKDFRKDLEREKRRSDRCKAPLSLAIFQLDGDARRTLAFLEVVHRVTRETDVVGHVANDMIALLCPDTNASGIEAALAKIKADAQGLDVNPVAVVTHPDMLFDRVSAGELNGDPRMPVGGNSEAIRLAPAFVSDRMDRKGHGYGLKRIIDVIGAAVGIVLLSPVMLLAALAVGLTSRGPIIFRQTRLGQGGEPFTFYKFRSMAADGDDRIHRAYVASLIDGKPDHIKSSGDAEHPLYKLQSDPRITPIGRIIRKTSIDELPQLFNVMKGDMSLVGPRPPIPYEAARYQAWHLRRLLAAKPGLTGLWQVEGRSKVSFDEMVRMDLRYIRDCSLELDMRIILKTFRVVLRCDGAA